MFSKYKEVISGFIVLVFGILYVMGTFSIARYGDAAVDSRFIPQILGALLIFLSVLQIINGIRGLSKTNGLKSQSKIGSYKRVLLTLANIIVYISLMKIIGFLIMTVIFTFLQIIILSNEKKLKYPTIAIVSVVFSILVYVVFVKGFALTLPSGILG